MTKRVLNYEVRRICHSGSSLRLTVPWSVQAVLDVAAGDYVKFIMEPKDHTVRLEKWRPLSDPKDQPRPIGCH